MNPKHLLLPALLAITLSCAMPAAHAHGPVYLGEFSSIVQSKDSEDCDGYAVRLWRLKQLRGADRIIGTYVHADGPCDQPATPLYDVQYSPATGRLRFAAPGAAESIRETNQFSGILGASSLQGKFTSINLDQPDVPAAATAVTLKRQPAASR